MADDFDLHRFVVAQSGVIETALAELRAGRKQSHWMWFIFPQLRVLGRSERASFYGISGAEEARAYLAHPVLGRRLREAVAAANAAPDSDAVALFGKIDAMKYRSCLTLFGAVAPDEPCFEAGLARFYGRKPCAATVEALGADQP